MKLLENLKLFLLKLTNQACPDSFICNYRKTGDMGQIKKFCGSSYNKCARYYLRGINKCDCVDDLLKPNEMKKAQLILKIENTKF